MTTPRDATLIDMLRKRVARHGERTVFTFLADGETNASTISYAELVLRAHRGAAHLQRFGGVGERALLVCPPGIEYIVAFYACVFAGWIPVPAYPPSVTRVTHATGRLRGIFRESRPLLLLTTSDVLPAVDELSAQVAEARGTAVINVDTDWSARGEDDYRLPVIDGDSVALLQYSSGSISSPKGVRVTHANLLHNMALSGALAGTGEQTRMVCWLPPYHDMGLIGGLIWPLFLGGEAVLMAPLRFLTRPIRWLRAVERYRGNHIVGPNFAYELCARTVTPELAAQLDLSSLEMAWVGAEPVRHGTLVEFAQRFRPSGFKPAALSPCYGLAEATLCVTGTPREQPFVAGTFSSAGLAAGVATEPASDADARALVSSGELPAALDVRIVDPETRQVQPEGRVGEVWIGGGSVAQGYFARPEETQATFHAFTSAGDGPLLRTGDLAFVRHRELFITGRLKDLILYRGRNIYPHDVELTLERAGFGLRSGCVAAFGIDGDREERVAVVAELDRHATRPEQPARMFEALAAAVAREHDLRLCAIALVARGQVPRTPSGKLQRLLCGRLWSAGELRLLAEWRDGRVTYPQDA